MPEVRRILSNMCRPIICYNLSNTLKLFVTTYQHFVGYFKPEHILDYNSLFFVFLVIEYCIFENNNTLSRCKFYYLTHSWGGEMDSNFYNPTGIRTWLSDFWSRAANHYITHASCRLSKSLQFVYSNAMFRILRLNNFISKHYFIFLTHYRI